MFGLGVTELMVLIIVGIVVVGPKKLPEMMRTAGGWISRLRRMSTDLRSQSGIDEILRAEGLEKEIRELRSLSRINVMDSLVNAANKPPPRALPARATTTGGASPPPGAPGASEARAAGAGAPASSTPATSSPAGSAAAASEASTPATSGLATSAPATTEPTVAGATDAGGPRIVPPGAPPPGAIASAAPNALPRPGGFGGMTAPVLLPGEEPLADREWPPWGCDSYDALPDDLDEEADASAPAELATGELAAADEPAGDPRVVEPGAA